MRLTLLVPSFAAKPSTQNPELNPEKSTAHKSKTCLAKVREAAHWSDGLHFVGGEGGGVRAKDLGFKVYSPP